MLRAIANSVSQALPDFSSISVGLSECFKSCGIASEDDTTIALHTIGAVYKNEMSKNEEEFKKFQRYLQTFPAQITTTVQIGYSSKTVLHAAAELGNLAAMRAILGGKFININALGVLHSHENDENLKRMTPLMFAVYHSQLDAVDLLLEYGADVNAKNSKGETAFMIWQRLNICGTVPHQFEASASQKSSETALLINRLNKQNAPVATELEHSEYMCRIC